MLSRFYSYHSAEIANRQVENIKLNTLGDTNDPDIKRVLDLNGDWTHYKVVSKNRFVPAVSHVLKLGFPKGMGFYNYLLSVSKEQSEKILEESGEKGSRVHSAIGDVIGGLEITFNSLYPNDITGRPEKLSQGEWYCLLAFKAFCEACKPEQIAVEKTVATNEYAGTIDFVGTMLIKETPKAEPKRIKVLLDWKSGGGIYDDYKLQTAAYFEALKDPFIEYTGVVRLGTKHKNGGLDNCGYEVKLWNKDETFRHYRAFESALDIFRLNDSEFKLDETEMPASIKLSIPKYAEPKTVPAKKATKVKVTADNKHVTIGIQNKTGAKRGLSNPA